MESGSRLRDDRRRASISILRRYQEYKSKLRPTECFPVLRIAWPGTIVLKDSQVFRGQKVSVEVPLLLACTLQICIYWSVTFQNKVLAWVTTSTQLVDQGNRVRYHHCCQGPQR